jgi:hypothetical protein
MKSLGEWTADLHAHLPVRGLAMVTSSMLGNFRGGCGALRKRGWICEVYKKAMEAGCSGGVEAVFCDLSSLVRSNCAR